MILDADNGDPQSYDLEVKSGHGDFSETMQWTKATALRVMAGGTTDSSELPLLTSSENVGDLENPCGR